MNDNINTDIENVEEVELTAGEMLRNARTTGRRKREILTIAKQLCIREEFLQALEEGNYSLIPEPVYILGFARNYAMELGLNPDEIVSKIKQEIGLVSDVASDNDASVVANKVRGKAKTGTTAGLLARCVAYVRAKWIWFATGGAISLVLIIGLIVALASNSGKIENVANSDAQVEAVAEPTEPVYNKDVRERFGVENRGKSRVILQAIQESWVQVKDGRGNTAFSRVLVPGDVYYVPLGANYKATFGNAGGIDIWVDSKASVKAGPAHTRMSDVSLDPDKLIKAETENKKSVE